MNEVLKRIKEIRAEGCVTIILNTHRTRPDNEKDSLKLKNLVKEAEELLYKEYDKRFVWPLMEKLHKLSDDIDHQQNLESLLLFVNQDIAEYTQLPLSVKDRVVIDATFATRDMVRAMHEQAGYYVLVLSRQNARLIEAFNDKVVKEIQGEFPIENTLYSTSKKELSTSKGTDNLIEEFFNRVDKTVQETIKENPLPIILATETRNVDHYLKVTDNKQNITGHINKNRDDEKAHHIVEEAWVEVKKLLAEKRQSKVETLYAAVKEGKLLTDLNDIWKALKEGRGDSVFVRKGYFQPARITEKGIITADKFDLEEKDVIDDLVDEMVEMTLQYGGDAFFLEPELMDEFGGLALITRY